MEKDSPSKPSVAELAGRLKGHILPTPNSSDEIHLPFRRNPPCTLKFQNPAHENEESDKSVSHSIKTKTKNSAMIEKLQANLALSPTALLPSPKGPEVKLQPTQLSPTVPFSPLSPTLRPSHLSSEEEDPISFDSPPEGTPLPNFNKTRARLSFKRRPPTRQHRRSAGEEVDVAGSELSPCELDSPKENGDKDQGLNNLTEEAESGHLDRLTEAENRDEDCEEMEAETGRSNPDDKRDLEQEVGQIVTAGAFKEDQELLESAEQIEGDDKTEREQDEKPEEAEQGENGDM